MNDCLIHRDNCYSGSNCTNSHGSFSCACEIGYFGDGVDSCIDIGECSSGTHMCSDHTICTNTIGSYDCDCKIGYRDDGRTCVDIDECAEKFLGDNITYENYTARFHCHSDDEYFQDTILNAITGDTEGYVCFDEIESARGFEKCHDHATCINEAGSFDCTSNNGYSGDGVTPSWRQL